MGCKLGGKTSFLRAKPRLTNTEPNNQVTAAAGMTETAIITNAGGLKYLMKIIDYKMAYQGGVGIRNNEESQKNGAQMQ